MTEIARLPKSAQSIIGAAQGLRDSVAVGDHLHEVLQSDEASYFLDQLGARSLDLSTLVRRDLSREVSTHYKWCLFASNELSLWINEYKETTTTTSYARSIHNHRYSFASRVITGEIRQRQFVVTHHEGVLQAIKIEKDFSCAEGQGYGIDMNTVHQIASWAPGTSTLVLKGPMQKSSSTVFDLADFSVRDVKSISSLAPQIFNASQLSE